MRLPAINLNTAASVAMLCVLCFPCSAQNKQDDSQKSSGQSNQTAVERGLLERGKYIADDLAVCSQCHTPRDAQGALDRSKWLEGAPLWLNPAQAIEDWPLQAPRIAGDPPGTDAEIIKLLTTGIWRDGKPLRAPMPQFRMSANDAQAVLAYLKSLTPQH